MKKIMIALALAGISFSGAEAQTKSSGPKQTCKCAKIERTAKTNKVAHNHRHPGSSTTTDTYQVCVEKDGHYDCCLHHKKVVKTIAK